MHMQQLLGILASFNVCVDDCVPSVCAPSHQHMQGHRHVHMLQRLSVVVLWCLLLCMPQTVVASPLAVQGSVTTVGASSAWFPAGCTDALTVAASGWQLRVGMATGAAVQATFTSLQSMLHVAVRQRQQQIAAPASREEIRGFRAIWGACSALTNNSQEQPQRMVEFPSLAWSLDNLHDPFFASSAETRAVHERAWGQFVALAVCVLDPSRLAALQAMRIVTVEQGQRCGWPEHTGLVVAAWPLTDDEWILCVKGAVVAGHMRTPKSLNNWVSNVVTVGLRMKLKELRQVEPSCVFNPQQWDLRELHREMHRGVAKFIRQHWDGSVARADHALPEEMRQALRSINPCTLTGAYDVALLSLASCSGRRGPTLLNFEMRDVVWVVTATAVAAGGDV